MINSGSLEKLKKLAKNKLLAEPFRRSDFYLGRSSNRISACAKPLKNLPL